MSSSDKPMTPHDFIEAARPVDDAQIQSWADEAEAGYDPASLRPLCAWGRKLVNDDKLEPCTSKPTQILMIEEEGAFIRLDLCEAHMTALDELDLLS